MNKIQYISKSQIDSSKWDECIINSINSRIYAHSWYLDLVSKNWGAFIYGNYELVFPVVYANRFFYKKIYHPNFCQQLGPFSPDANLLFDDNIIYDLFNVINNKYSQFFFSINFDCVKVVKNIIINRGLNINYVTRINLELNLKLNYKQLYSHYSENISRNLKACNELNFYIKSIDDVSAFIFFYKKYISQKANLKSSDLKLIKSIIQSSMKKKYGSMYALFDNSNNIVAAAFFISYLDREVLLFNFSTKKFKFNAMVKLIDYYIQLNASQNKWLDFEGSTIPGLMRFYKGFGASEKNYLLISK
ncbi:MAG: hypothetical protein CMP49_05950 [Flavobacteriales bacterium]|nr:hypothetical protein [Flavobacteriales bacterium]|tara:strand:+ start:144 stop:1055 length:912 start_codon:yes stop_codon:yes gene_type:complete